MAANLEGRAAGDAVTGNKKEPSTATESSSSLKSLPIDLAVEILRRLPVKTLIRSSCVEKSWYAIIKNPIFIHSQAKSSNFMTWDDHYFPEDCFSKDDYVSKFPHGLQTILLPRVLRMTYGPVSIAGYCHGVVCAYWWSMSDDDNWMPIFALCNPATHEFRILPESRLGLPPYKMLEDVNAGFGYDPKANDYKIVKLAHLVGNSNRIDAVEIYSLSTDSWKVIDVFQHHVQIYGIDCSGKHTDDGFYHWILYDEYDDDYDCYGNAVVLVSFDMGNEVMRVTQLPEKYTAWRKKPSTKKYAGYSISLLHDERLTVVFSFCEPQGTTTFEIYELNRDYSWSHVFSVESIPFHYSTLGFWKTDELLVLRRLPGPSWSHTGYVPMQRLRSDDDRFELVRRGYPFLYNVVTKQSRDLYLSREVNHIYKQSLVPIKGRSM